MFKVKNRFRFKLTVAFATIAFIPLLLMGIVAVTTIYQTRSQSVIELENQNLLHIKERITKFILEKAKTSKLIIDAPLKDAQNFKKEQIKFFLESFNEEVSDIVEIVMLNKSGDEIGKLSNYHQITRRDQISQKNLKTYTEAIKDKNSIYYGPIEHTMIGPIITISTPILNGQEDIIGVTVVKIKADLLTKSIENSVIGISGYFLLVDSDGYFISDGSRWLSDTGQTLKFIEQDQNNHSTKKTEGVFYEQRSISNQLLIIGKMMASEKFGWQIITVWPKRDAFAVVNTIILEVILTTLVSLLIVLFLSTFLSGQVVKPIELLEAKAALIGQGQLDQNINITTNDEIEDLGESFNKMAKGLQEIQKLKDEFVFIAAHELRTPVTVIRWCLSMVADGDFGKVDEKLLSTLQKANSANDQLVQLVNDLLEIARAEAGRTKIDVKEVDLVEVIKKATDSLNTWAQGSNIKLIYEKPAGGLMVLADENKLTEVLNNLGSNAIKYNRPNGSVIIKHKDLGKEILTIVEDTGIGLTKEEVDHLFEKFYRAENEDTRKVQGTGLGLFIIKQLVEKMGGKITVQSERGKGSIFSFTLKKAK